MSLDFGREVCGHTAVSEAREWLVTKKTWRQPFYYPVRCTQIVMLLIGVLTYHWNGL